MSAWCQYLNMFKVIHVLEGGRVSIDANHPHNVATLCGICMAVSFLDAFTFLWWSVQTYIEEGQKSPVFVHIMNVAVH